MKLSNLLLVNEGTSLKIICNVGITCDNVYSNINKDKTVWMAPEVFEGLIKIYTIMIYYNMNLFYLISLLYLGNKYTEKSDVYSWGLILWQVLTRQKIFGELEGCIYKVMCAICQGIRPPMIDQCPRPLQDLITQ